MGLCVIVGFESSIFSRRDLPSGVFPANDHGNGKWRITRDGFRDRRGDGMSSEPGRSSTILLIEDIVADADLTRAAFQQRGDRVDLRCVADGAEALDYLRRRGGWADRPAPRPDVILLDLNMPVMDGRTFLSEVKRDTDLASIPVVVLTTSETEGDVQAAYRGGAAGYVVKPVDVDQFFDAIGHLENYWMSLVRLPRP